MIMSQTIRTILTFALFTLITQLSIAQDRNTLVLNDRERVTNDGYWIYNNLDKGLEQAKENGKPVLVVLRCIPCEACAQLDEQVVEKNPAVRKHLSNFVCVRMVYANGMDLSRFQFDFDQSWAVFFLHSDGTILGRYGTRSHQSESEDDVTLEGFLDSMQAALALDKKFDSVKDSLAGKACKPLDFARPEDFPKLKEKYSSSIKYGPEVARSCIHCHQIGDAIREYNWTEKKSIPTEWVFTYPHPKIFGMIMDPKKATTIKSVTDHSLAHEAGFKAGDQLINLQGQPLLSVADIQWILQQHDGGAGRLNFKVLRNGADESMTLKLPEKWKEMGDISWRASSWGYRRMVSGGLSFDSLDAGQRSEFGLDAQAIGLKVKHVGQFNAHAAAKRAGFKVGDVFIAVDGTKEPMTESQWIAKMLRTKRPGDHVSVELLRDGKTIKLELPIQE
jgi:serine protease Do